MKLLFYEQFFGRRGALLTWLRSSRREIEAYRFIEEAAAVDRFVWNKVFDWHLELAKPVFSGDDEATAITTKLLCEVD